VLSVCLFPRSRVPSEQYPSLAPVLYPGDLATAVTPFASVVDMWQAFACLATNKTPAMNGADYFSLPTQGPTTASKPARTGGSSGQKWASGSSQNPVVLSVESHDRANASFTRDYNAWPASQSDWSTVFQVSSSFSNHTDPFLWTPLLTQDARSQAFRENKGKCLNCGSTDHSMKYCRSEFLNTSGLLNPELGRLDDNSDAFRRWQDRMKSYRAKTASSAGGGGRNRKQRGFRRRGPANDRQYNDSNSAPHNPPYSNNSYDGHAQNATPSGPYQSGGHGGGRN